MALSDRTAKMHTEYTPAEIARFWSRVDRSGGKDACWIWTRSHTSAGYGNMTIRQVGIYAHRLAYFLAHGPIPDGMYVCHQCDNPPCCNPAHLFLGSPQENITDKESKRRHGPVFVRLGEDHHSAKLTERDVQDIREQYAAGIKPGLLAQRYGVHRDTIRNIAQRKNWSHI